MTIAHDEPQTQVPAALGADSVAPPLGAYGRQDRGGVGVRPLLLELDRVERGAGSPTRSLARPRRSDLRSAVALLARIL